MKLKRINTLIAIVAIALTSCEQSCIDSTSNVESDAISFREIPEALTRVVDNTFESGDKVMFDAYTSAGDIHADNYTYIYNNGVFTSESPIKYPTSGESLSFIASYPATSYLSKSFTYSATTDQSKASSYESNDLLIAHIDVTAEAQPSVQFKHVMSCVELTIESGSSFSNIKIHAKNQVSCNAETMTFTAIGNEVEITPEALGDNKYRILVAPQTISTSLKFITATLNGVDYSWSASSVGNLEAGMKYALNCTLSEDKVAIAPSDVFRSGWAELPNEIVKSGDYYYAHHLASSSDNSKARNFSACYSDKFTCPVWVAGPYHKSYCSGSGDRRNNYRDDPDIPCYQVETLGSPYNRGHMIASSDRLGTQAMNNQAFYLSNIAPQLLSGFNSGGGIWNNYEDEIQEWYQNRSDTLYVVNGCHWENTKKVVNGTTVPTHYYKALLRCKQANSKKFVKDCSRDELECVVFYLPHVSSSSKPSRSHMITVEALEKKTGFKYFTNVPNAPKDSFNASDWGL